MRYRSQPSEVEAVRWDGENDEEVLGFAPGKVELRGPVLHLLAGVDGAQGWVPVPLHHWLVSNPGDRSDVWPVDQDYFAGKYRPASIDDHGHDIEVRVLGTMGDGQVVQLVEEPPAGQLLDAAATVVRNAWVAAGLSPPIVVLGHIRLLSAADVAAIAPEP